MSNPQTPRYGINSGRRPNNAQNRRRGKHMRVPRRAYPLWRRASVRTLGAGLLITALGVWLWLDGSFHTAQLSAQNWVQRELASLGFTVQKVTVTGREEIPVSSILTALQVTRGQSVFDLDTETAKHRIEALGWAKSAAVSRYWPDTIHIDLVERRPFVLWQQKRKFTLIDREGAAITRQDLGRFASLPVVVGPGARQSVAQLIDILVTEPDLYQQVRAATRIGRRRWDLHFENGVVVRLPADAETVAWQRLALLEQDYRILERDIKVIDLRLPNRLVVRLAPISIQHQTEPGEEA